jgi:hypothetical protein
MYMYVYLYMDMYLYMHIYSVCVCVLGRTCFMTMLHDFFAPSLFVAYLHLCEHAHTHEINPHNARKKHAFTHTHTQHSLKY